MEIWCIDLDDTISAFPDEFCALMTGLRDDDDQVHVLTGHTGDSVDQSVIDAKIALLDSLGCSSCWDKLVAVANPTGDVADQKVSYMKTVGAKALIDNKKANVKAAQKAGFLAMRVK